MSNDVFVQYLNMDTMIKEHVFANADGTYTIFINARLCREEQLNAYMHALNHIIRGDFDCDNIRTVDEIEYTAHCKN